MLTEEDAEGVYTVALRIAVPPERDARRVADQVAATLAPHRVMVMRANPAGVLRVVVHLPASYGQDAAAFVPLWLALECDVVAETISHGPWRGPASSQTGR